jgi:hypothetical protein
LLIDEAELFALVGLSLDAPHLIRGGLVVQQQHDQALHRGECFEGLEAGELVAGAGGEQPSLSVVEHDRCVARLGAVADARD